jgi:hypothetical protein
LRGEGRPAIENSSLDSVTAELGDDGALAVETGGTAPGLDGGTTGATTPSIVRCEGPNAPRFGAETGPGAPRPASAWRAGAAAAPDPPLVASGTDAAFAAAGFPAPASCGKTGAGCPMTCPRPAGSTTGNPSIVRFVARTRGCALWGGAAVAASDAADGAAADG